MVKVAKRQGSGIACRSWGVFSGENGPVGKMNGECSCHWVFGKVYTGYHVAQGMMLQ